jgi:hypothetical protein
MEIGGCKRGRVDCVITVLAAATGCVGAVSVAVAAHPVPHGLYKGAATERVDHKERTYHARARFRASDDGTRVSYVRVRYWIPCAKLHMWFDFHALPVSASGRFHQRSGAEYEGGPVGEEATYISGRFIESGDAVRFHFNEQARVYTGHHDPARGHECSHVRVTGTAHLRG